MPSASTQGVLGLVVALLAVAALAQTRPESGSRELVRPESLPRASSAVRALRDGQTLDINHAQPADLVLLPGVGPKLAERIVEERGKRGGFRHVNELLEVHGIGPVKFEALARFVNVAGAAAASAQRSNSSAPESVPVK